MEWTRENVVRLIRLFKERPILYRYKNVHGFKPSQKELAYAEIVQQMIAVMPELTVSIVQKKIRLLCRQLTVCAQQMKAKPEHRNHPSLWCYNELSFLLSDYSSNISNLGPNSSAAHRAESQGFIQETLPHYPPTETVTFFPNKLQPTPPNSPEGSTVKLSRDDTAIYADSWAATFRKLNAEQQIFAKAKIDEILLRGQLGLLKFPGDPAPCNTTSTPTNHTPVPYTPSVSQSMMPMNYRPPYAPPSTVMPYANRTYFLIQPQQVPMPMKPFAPPRLRVKTNLQLSEVEEA